MLTIARTVFAFLFILFGLNGFVRFLPVPTLDDDGALFMMLLADSGFLYVVKAMEVVGGAMLLTQRFRLLGAALTAPLAVCIFLFHLFLDDSHLVIGGSILALWFLTYWPLRTAFEPLFQRRAPS